MNEYLGQGGVFSYSMKMTSLLKPVLLMSVTSLLATGCVVHEVRYRDRPVVVQPPPPPPMVVQTAPATPPPPGVVEQPGQEIVVTEAPPAAIVEVQTVAPGPGYLWIPGAWVWHGRWVWEGGRWGHRPRPGAVWVGPHYAYRGGVHVYVRGGWRF